MKQNVFTLLLLLISSFCYSQSASVTKKYNSLNKRYEYFDSSGAMIGYEKYNSFSKQLEYYDLKSQYSRQPRQYGDYIEPLDNSSLLNIESNLKQRGIEATNQAIVKQSNYLRTYLDEHILDKCEHEKTREYYEIFIEKIIDLDIDGTKDQRENILIWMRDSFQSYLKNAIRDCAKNSSNYSKSSNSSKEKGSSAYSTIAHGAIGSNIVFKEDKEKAKQRLQQAIELYENYANYEWESDYKSAILLVIVRRYLDFKNYTDANIYNEKMFADYPNTKAYYYLNKAEIAFSQEKYKEVISLLNNLSIQDENSLIQEEKNPLYKLSVIYEYYGNFYTYRGVSKIKGGKKSEGCADIKKAIKNYGFQAGYYDNQYCKK